MRRTPIVDPYTQLKTDIGFRTLDVATLNPALQAVRRAEESAGFPMAHRICMQLDL
jgi:hypothetical protein